MPQTATHTASLPSSRIFEFPDRRPLSLTLPTCNRLLAPPSFLSFLSYSSDSSSAEDQRHQTLGSPLNSALLRPVPSSTFAKLDLVVVAAAIRPDRGRCCELDDFHGPPASRAGLPPSVPPSLDLPAVSQAGQAVQDRNAMHPLGRQANRQEGRYSKYRTLRPQTNKR